MTSLLHSALDLRLSEVAITEERVVVRSTPGLVRRSLAAVLSLPFLMLASSAVRHPSAAMLGLALVSGLVTLPFLLLLGAAVQEKSFGRDSLVTSLQLFGWSSRERFSVPPHAAVVVRVASTKGGRRFTISVGRGMDLSVFNDQAQALEVAQHLSKVLGVRVDDQTQR
ncbi:MAG: hypothetical protein ABTQ32_00915 [Myxococcaceae bacterium]